MKSIKNDIANTVFSFIPNTAEIAYYGMLEQLRRDLELKKAKQILKIGEKISPSQLDAIISQRIRAEKIAVKDAKLRTFITADISRNDLVAHVYDITYGVIQKNKDSLVVIDDSIVRGTTLRESILRILDRLNPRKIIVVSSAPQIRYPDCYGIDMARLGDFVAFNAAIELLKEGGESKLIKDVYKRARAQESLPKEEIKNLVKEIYAPFTPEDISKKISELLRPPDIRAEVEIIYQSIEGLRQACPDHTGDWYFTGNYPTPGGNKVVNRALINYVEGVKGRAY